MIVNSSSSPELNYLPRISRGIGLDGKERCLEKTEAKANAVFSYKKLKKMLYRYIPDTVSNADGCGLSIIPALI